MMKNVMIGLLALLLIGCGRSGDLTMEDDTASLTMEDDTASVSSNTSNTSEGVGTTEQMITDVQVQSGE